MARSYYYQRPGYPQPARRHHGRNWPTNINSPGMHTFQRPPDRLPDPLVEIRVDGERFRYR